MIQKLILKHHRVLLVNIQLIQLMTFIQQYLTAIIFRIHLLQVTAVQFLQLLLSAIMELLMFVNQHSGQYLYLLSKIMTKRDILLPVLNDFHWIV